MHKLPSSLSSFPLFPSPSTSLASLPSIPHHSQTTRLIYHFPSLSPPPPVLILQVLWCCSLWIADRWFCSLRNSQQHRGKDKDSETAHVSTFTSACLLLFIPALRCSLKWRGVSVCRSPKVVPKTSTTWCSSVGLRDPQTDLVFRKHSRHIWSR